MCVFVGNVTMTENEEKREATRAPARVAVEINSADKTVTLDRTRDVSMKGIFCETDDILPMGSACRVGIQVGGPEGGSAIGARAKVVRVENDGMGLEFVELIGMESYTHLRNLVLHNSEDPDTVEAEIERRAGLKAVG